MPWRSKGPHEGGAAWMTRSKSLRERLADWLQQSGADRLIDIVQTALSIAACGIYIAQTYAAELADRPVYFWLEMGLTSFFAADYLLQLFVAENRLRHAASLFAIVDLLTIVPVLATLGNEDGHHAEDGGPVINFTVLRVVRVLRVLRVLRVYRLLRFSEHSYKSHLLTLVFTLASLVFCWTGLIQAVEVREQEDFSFHRAFYFVVVTISTVGYGDVSPVTEAGRMLVVVLLLLVALLVPQQLSGLRGFRINDAALVSFVDVPGNGHVILSGPLDLWSIEGFLEEFYHAGHGKQLAHVVILCPFSPTKVLKRMLQVAYKDRVTYLQGSITHVADQNRANVLGAMCCFLLSPPPLQSKAGSMSVDDIAVARDGSVVLSAMAVRKRTQTLLIYGQVALPESQQRLQWAIGASGQAVCTAQLKGNLIARNVLCPGALIFVSNLLHTTSSLFVTDNRHRDWEDVDAGAVPGLVTADSEGDEAATGRGRGRGGGGSSNPSTTLFGLPSARLRGNREAGDGTPISSDDDSASEAAPPRRSSFRHHLRRILSSAATDSGSHTWFGEFLHGASFEIYPMVCSKRFRGVRFDRAVVGVYEQFGAIMLGVFLHGHVALFPRSYRLREGELAFVLGHSAAHIHMIGEMFSAELPSVVAASRGDAAGPAGAKSGAAAAVAAAGCLPEACPPLTGPDRADKRKHVISNSTAFIATSGLPLKTSQESSTVARHKSAAQLARLYSWDETVYEDVPEEMTDEDLLAESRPPASVFWVRDKPVSSVEDITRRSVGSLTGHVVICGSLARSQLIVPMLRARTVVSPPRIVLLHEHPPPAAAWSILRWFPGVWYVRGSPDDERALKRAAVQHALHVVLLKDVRDQVHSADEPTALLVPKPSENVPLPDGGGNRASTAARGAAPMPSGGSDRGVQAAAVFAHTETPESATRSVAATLCGDELQDYGLLVNLLSIKSTFLATRDAGVHAAAFADDDISAGVRVASPVRGDSTGRGASAPIRGASESKIAAPQPSATTRADLLSADSASPSSYERPDLVDLMPHTTVELSHAPNVRFVLPCLTLRSAKSSVLAVERYLRRDATRDSHWFRRSHFADPAFAGSFVVSERMLVTLCTLSYYNPYLSSVVDALLSAPSLDDPDESVGAHDDDDDDGIAFFAASRPPTMVMQSYGVAPQFHGRQFVELFASCVAYKQLPVALHRSSRVHGSPLPYVLTCPPMTTRVGADDRVLVIEQARTPQ